MCSIIGSFDLEKFLELVKLNQSRGTFSFSFATLFINNGEILSVDLIKQFGEFQENVLATQNSPTPFTKYYIGHVQAPTGGLLKEPGRIHPSVLQKNRQNSYLWHNGILKENCITTLQTRNNRKSQWDTKLLHLEIWNHGLKSLSNIDGSFGCVLISLNRMYIFTSDIITLFIDNEFNLSSIPFTNSRRIDPNFIHMMDFNEQKLIASRKFQSLSSPYYFGN